MNEFISRKHVILIFSIFKKKKKIFLVNILLDKLLAINLQLLILLINTLLKYNASKECFVTLIIARKS